MFDKVEMRVTNGRNQFTPEMEDVIADLRSLKPSIKYTQTPYYAAMVDLREVPSLKVDAKLHICSRNGKGDHKLELLDTGEKTWDEMMTISARVVRTSEVEQLDVMRLDPCTDIEDVSMDWVARSVRCERKRWQKLAGKIEMLDNKHEEVDFTEIGKRRLETVYLGKGSNLLRVYNKIEEEKFRYERARRRHYVEMRKQLAIEAVGDNPGLIRDRDYMRGLTKRIRDTWGWSEIWAKAQAENPFPSFEEWSGHMPWAVLTRFERQMRDIPVTLSKIGAVRDNALAFNPFDRLRFSPPRNFSIEELQKQFSPGQLLKVVGAWHLLNEEGWTYHELYQFMNLNRNGVDFEERYGSLLRTMSDSVSKQRGIEAEELFEGYRAGVRRQFQLAA